MKENNEYKSDVFSMLMRNKEYALTVYNALNNSDYTDANQIEMIFLQRGVSLTMRNDASFIIDMNLNIYEHQSTYNPNMPLRSLIYLGDILKDYVKDRKLDLFSRKKIIIPSPHFVVFYNGIENRPEKEYLRLSDSFYVGCVGNQSVDVLTANENDKFIDGEIEDLNWKIENTVELVCTVYNINPGYNHEMMDRCWVLDQYTQFVEKVREYKTTDMAQPIETAISYCIDNDILSDFLKKHRGEVTKAMTLDMTWEVREGLIRKEEFQDGYNSGISKGIEQTTSDIVKRMLKTGKYSQLEIAMNCNISEEEVRRIQSTV